MFLHILIYIRAEWKGVVRLCLRVWRGGYGLEGGKYREKWGNLSHFLKEYFF